MDKRIEHFLPAPTQKVALSHLFLSIYIEHVRPTGRNHFLATDLLPPWLEMLGCSIHYLPQGPLSPDAIEAQLKPRTLLVSLSWASLTTGIIQPIVEIGKFCQEKGILFHVDAENIRSPFSFSDLPVDFMTTQSGILSKTKLPHHFEEISVIPPNNLDWLEIAHQRNSFEKQIIKGFPGAKILFENFDRLPDVSAIDFPHVASDALLFALKTLCIKKLSHSALSFRFPLDLHDDQVLTAAHKIRNIYE